ncbi:MAG: ABC transporter ATP-binding protein [Bacteroides sp.]|nr:MAG: ABC transporter ATP-binding protein [Bacteroides sp.]
MKTNSSYNNTIKSIFFNIILPKKMYIFIGIVLITINKICSLIIPGSSKYIIDVVIPNKNIKMLKLIILLVVIAILIQAISSFLLTKILSVNAQKLIYELRISLLNKILQLPISFFHSNTSGSLISRIINDVEGAKNFIGTGLVYIIGGFFNIIICFILLFRTNHLMALYVLIPIIIFFVISLKSFIYIRPIFREKNILKSKMTSRLNETLNGINVIKCFNAENHEISFFKKHVINLFNNVKKCLLITSIISNIITVVIGLSLVMIMGFGSYLIINDKMTLGDFISFTMYLGFMITPMIQISSIGSQITESIAGLDRVEEIMDITVENNNKKYKINNIKGEIHFKNVSLSYDNKIILNNISFYIPTNATTALVGASGAGKTSIAYMIAGLILPTKGNIYIDGNNLKDIDLYHYRKYIGVVLQNDFLFDGTIKDNIKLANVNASNKDIDNALRLSYVDLFLDKLPNGINTIIGERGSKLSGGQRQRISIARAILANPKINILDEATSSLDTYNEFLIQKSLSNLKYNKTTIVVAHRLATVKSADQIIVIDSGKVIEQGDHDLLMKNKGQYYKLFTYQSTI